MKKFIRLIPIFIFILSAVSSYAGEVVSFGSAKIIKGNLKNAVNNSLNMALMNSIIKYDKENEINRKGNITEDYFTFIKEYRIISKEIKNGAVVTKVSVVINDIIADEVALNVTKQVNTAVFIVNGFSPTQVGELEQQKLVTNELNARNFYTRKQNSFNEAIVDKTQRADILTAFSLSSARYLFDFVFTIKSSTEKDKCIVSVDAKYTTSDNIYKVTPITQADGEFTHTDKSYCYYQAAKLALNSVLDYTRSNVIETPDTNRVIQSYTIKFVGFSDLRSLNEIIAIIQKRKYLEKATMTEFTGREAVFSVESYFTPSELLPKISELPYFTDMEAIESSEGLELIISNKKN